MFGSRRGENIANLARRLLLGTFPGLGLGAGLARLAAVASLLAWSRSASAFGRVVGGRTVAASRGGSNTNSFGSTGALAVLGFADFPVAFVVAFVVGLVLGRVVGVVVVDGGRVVVGAVVVDVVEVVVGGLVVVVVVVLGA